MKRNETVLVYAVTGLLLVILLVAVVFGEQNPAKAEPGEKARPKVASLPGVTPAETPEQPVNGGTEGTASTADPGKESAPPEVDDADAKTGGEAEPAEKKADEQPTDPAKKAGAEDAGVGLNNTVNATPAVQLEGVLGKSRKMGQYRVVVARRGDTLKRVVERWCAEASHLSTAEVLNESLVEGSLNVGQEVVLPWVDAEVLLAAERARAKKVAEIEYARGELYTLKRGDSLWNLAKVRVARNMIPAWLERFKQLNPDITDPSVLIAGQKVRLPR